jgi:hypothetical protein
MCSSDRGHDLAQVFDADPVASGRSPRSSRAAALPASFTGVPHQKGEDCGGDGGSVRQGSRLAMISPSRGPTPPPYARPRGTPSAPRACGDRPRRGRRGQGHHLRRPHGTYSVPPASCVLPGGPARAADVLHGRLRQQDRCHTHPRERRDWDGEVKPESIPFPVGAAFYETCALLRPAVPGLVVGHVPGPARARAARPPVCRASPPTGAPSSSAGLVLRPP